MNVSPSTHALIMHFGEMGSRWGFNRTVGQIFAMITLHPEPVNADQLSEALQISRGNVSMGLKELQAWRLIDRKHIPGDRKEYFEAAGSVWELARRVFEERRKRELDPTLSLLRQQLLDSPQTQAERHSHEKMQEMYEVLEQLDTFANALNDISPERLQALMKMGKNVTKVLSFGGKSFGDKKKGA